jgi:hypothetical protein
MPDCRLDLVSPEVGSNVVNPCCWPGEAANGMDQPNSVVDCCRGWFVNFRMIFSVGLAMPNGGRCDHGPQIIATSLR